MPPTPKPIYTIHDLVNITGVSKRTIRYWIEFRLLQSSYPVRPGSWQEPRYGREHVERIRKLQKYFEHRANLNDLAERIEMVGDKALDVPDVYADE